MNNPIARYEHSTIAPLVKRAEQKRTHTPARPMPRLRYACAAGIAGFGLCVGGWYAFGTNIGGALGFTIIFLMAMYWVWSGGLGVEHEQAPEQAPNPKQPLLRAWGLMTTQERLRLWPQLTDVQKGVLVAEAEKRQSRRG